MTKYEIRKNRHDPKWLTDKYVKEHLSQREIAELCDTGSSTIGDQLRQHGISRDRKYRNESWLREKYEDDGLTMEEMADTTGVGLQAVQYWMIEHGIKRRDPGFRSGEDHPLWKEDNATDHTRLAKWADQVKERDGHACVACSSTERLHAHHVVPKYEDQSEEMLYGLDNGETLCRACHAKRHRERGDESIARLLRHTPH